MKKLSFLVVCMLVMAPALFAKTRTGAADSTKYADLYGKYKFDPGGQVDEADIIWRDTGLVISTAMGDATLDMLGVDSFHMSYMDGIITFKRGADKKVKGLHISVSGAELDAAKVMPATTFIRKEDMLNTKKSYAAK